MKPGNIDEIAEEDSDKRCPIIPRDLDSDTEEKIYIPEQQNSDFQHIKFVLTSCSDYEASDAFSVLQLEAKHADSIVGSIFSRFVRKEEISEKIFDEGVDFQLEMDDPSEDCSNLARTLFDHEGLLQDRWADDPILMGSGAWSDELSQYAAGFLVLEEVFIEKEWRRKGLGKRMVGDIMREAEKRGADFVFAWPTQLNYKEDAWRFMSPGEERAKILDANRVKAISFFRALGFRRIGASHCE